MTKRKASKKKSRALASTPDANGPIRDPCRLPKIRWVIWSGRQRTNLLRQAKIWGMPTGERTINIPAMAKWIHDFIAVNAERLLKNGKDDDGLLDGPNTPWLDRLRRAKTKREEFRHECDKREWIKRDEIHHSMALFAQKLRLGFTKVERRFGKDAQKMIDKALTDAAEAFKRAVDKDDGRHNNTPSG